MEAIYLEATNKTLGGILRTHVKAAQRYHAEAGALRDDNDAYRDRAAFVETALAEIRKVAEILEASQGGPMNAKQTPLPQRVGGSVWVAIGLGLVVGSAIRALLS